MKIESWLSLQIGTVLIIIPISASRYFIHIACQLVSDKTIYSASVDDKATVFCAWDCHVKILVANLKKLPVMEQHICTTELNTPGGQFKLQVICRKLTCH